MLYVALIGVTYLGFKSVPEGFIPQQDKEYLVAFAQLPEAATLDRTEDVIRRNKNRVELNPTCGGLYLQIAWGRSARTTVWEWARRWREGPWHWRGQVLERTIRAGPLHFEGPEVTP